MRFPSPKFYDADFLKVAADMLKQIYKPGYNYNKYGVTLYSLVESSAGIQGSLFSSEEVEESEFSAKKRAAVKTVDAINSDKLFIRPAILYKDERNWLPKSEMKSESAKHMLQIEEDDANIKDRTAFRLHSLDYAK